MNNKKKILHVVESFGGGVFTFFVDLLNEIADEYEIVIAYSKRPQTPENFKEYFNSKIRFIEVKNFTRKINPVKDLKAFFEIRKIIKEENPDIIHLHSSKAGFTGRFAANGKKKTILYNPHGFSFLMQDVSKIRRGIYWLIEKIGSLRKCTIIGCSKSEYEKALQLTKTATYINNGLNLERLKNESKELPKKDDVDLSKLKICTVGRIGFQKNPKMFNQIAEAFPDIQFTWIGDGELKGELTSKNINITGWKNREEVLKILNENDIFILTSLWEGLAISLLEAMYMKKICIVNGCIGNKDVINGTNGIVCNNLNEFLDTIKNIQTGNIDIQGLGQKGYDDIINIYNTDNMVYEYKKIYESKTAIHD